MSGVFWSRLPIIVTGNGKILAAGLQGALPLFDRLNLFSGPTLFELILEASMCAG